MPPLGEVAHEMGIRPPKWKEVQELVRRANPSSAPGPNGVPYQVYKSAPEILTFLWRQSKQEKHMDDLKLVTTTVPCTKRLLDRINGNLRWASMKVQPSKF